jgi:hypothetical protein
MTAKSKLNNDHVIAADEKKLAIHFLAMQILRQKRYVERLQKKALAVAR